MIDDPRLFTDFGANSSSVPNGAASLSGLAPSVLTLTTATSQNTRRRGDDGGQMFPPRQTLRAVAMPIADPKNLTPMDQLSPTSTAATTVITETILSAATRANRSSPGNRRVAAPTSSYTIITSEGEHEEDDGVENDVSLLGVLAHSTHVDSMTLEESSRIASSCTGRGRLHMDGALLPKR